MPIQEMIAIRNSGSRESNLALLMAMRMLQNNAGT